MKIGLIQYSPVWENIPANLSRVDEIISDSKEKFDLLILPEMSFTGFTMNPAGFYEEEDGISLNRIISLASKLKSNIIFGRIEKYHGKFYNALIHLDRSGLIFARYFKVHPFSFASEDKYYSAGDETVITEIDKTHTGLSICYDLRFPELYRQYAKKKAQVMINIANWPVRRIEHWKALNKARAIENQCFFIGVNRIGTDPFNNYNGNSCVFDPLGQELLCIPDNEGVFTVEIDPDYSQEIREKLPFLNDMRLI